MPLCQASSCKLMFVCSTRSSPYLCFLFDARAGENNIAPTTVGFTSSAQLELKAWMLIQAATGFEPRRQPAGSGALVTRVSCHATFSARFRSSTTTIQRSPLFCPTSNDDIAPPSRATTCNMKGSCQGWSTAERGNSRVAGVLAKLTAATAVEPPPQRKAVQFSLWYLAGLHQVHPSRLGSWPTLSGIVACPAHRAVVQNSNVLSQNKCPKAGESSAWKIETVQGCHPSSISEHATTATRSSTAFPGCSPGAVFDTSPPRI